MNCSDQIGFWLIVFILFECFNAFIKSVISVCVFIHSQSNISILHQRRLVLKTVGHSLIMRGLAVGLLSKSMLDHLFQTGFLQLRGLINLTPHYSCCLWQSSSPSARQDSQCIGLIGVSSILLLIRSAGLGLSMRKI